MKPSVSLFPRAAVVAFAGFLVAGTLPARAAPTQISNVPISSTRSAEAKPNVMLLMDTSESMSYTHMPDEVEEIIKPTSVGYKNSQCNSLYYNPSQPYNKLPRRYDGSFFDPASFGTARVDAFDTLSTDTKDLSREFQSYDNGSSGTARQTVRKPNWPAEPQQAAYYYVYEGTQTITPQSDACKDPDVNADRPASGPGGGMWRRVVVGLGEQAKFANWYSYGRTRMLLTKTAVSLSFNALNESHRVGFITVDPTVGSTNYPAVNPAKFLAVSDFLPGPGNQRNLWYDKLFSQKPAGTSPAREGLARVGRYYGNKFDGINRGMGGVDPMQYSCQQNFTIMTTDGYWNAQRETKASDLGGSFLGGPVNLDGTALVGNQDGVLTGASGNTPPGVWDGFADALKTSTDRLETLNDVPCVANGVTYQSVTRTVSKIQTFTQTTRQYQKTSHQLKSQTAFDSRVTDVYARFTKQYELYTDQYNTQTLNYALDTVQTTFRRVPFTTKTTSYFTTEVLQLQETASTITQTDTPWTKRISEQYRTTATQWLASTSVDRAKTSVYREGQTKVFKATYQIIQTDAEHEFGAISGNCVPQAGVVECERSNLTPFTPTAGACVNGSNTGSPDYIFTECREDTIVPFVPINRVCTDGVTTDPTTFVRTTCTETPVTPIGPVTACTGAITFGPSSQITTCQTYSLTPPTAIDTSTTACPNGQNPTTLVTTTCTSGPLAHGSQGSDVCSGTQNSGAPDFVNTICTHDGPNTTYVTASSCTQQTGNIGNNWIPTVTCTPGTVVGPRFVANCSPHLEGTAGTDTAVDVTCGVRNVQSSAVVESCTNGAGTTNDATPPFTQRVCTNTGPSAHAARPSAECTPGTDPAVTPLFTTTICVRNGPTETYVPLASNCQIRTASDTNGGETTTCVTPPEDPETDGPCTGGVTGTGASQATIVCGSRPTGTAQTAYCDTTAAPVNQGGGIITTCGVVVGPTVPSPTCTVGDTYGTAPPYTGSRCNRVQQTRFVDPPCVDGSDTPPDSGNNYTRSVCNIRNQTGPTAVATCDPAVIGVSAGPGYVNTSCTKTPVPALTGPYNGNCTPMGSSFDGTQTTVCSRTYSSPTPQPVQSCAFGAGVVRDTASPFGLTTCGDAYATNPSVFVPDLSPASCTPIATPVGPDWLTVDCDTLTSVDNATACTDGSSSNSGFPDYKQITCSAPPPSAEQPDNCSNGTTFNPTTLETKFCRTIEVSPPVVANCTPSAPPVAPTAYPWDTVRCTQASGTGLRRTVSLTETITRGRYSGTNLIGSAQVTGPTPLGTSDYDGGVCHIAGLNPLPPLPTAPTRPTTGMPSGCSQWPCTTSAALPGGSENSLADVAQYYYVNDLRPGMVDDVPFGGSGALDDRLQSQHMTTFTIALGASGTLAYRPDYRTAAGDFANIVAMTSDWPKWPDTTIDYINPSSDGSTGIRRWEDPRSIDDFWHTATNGRGRYYSAKDPGATAAGVTEALLGIEGQLAAGAAAGVTTLEPVAGNNSSFEATYTTSKWTGDVVAKRFDLASGVSTISTNWTDTAGNLLKARVKDLCDSRKIYLLRPLPSASLVDFAYGTRSCDSLGGPGPAIPDGLSGTEIGYLGDSAVQGLSQYVQMTDLTVGTPDQKTPAAGANFVNFLRGQTGFEGFESGVANRLYRKRDSPLGDIVHAQPVYVKAPFASYADAGYSAYKSANLNRTPIVYVAANDGMLHAFNAGDGIDSAIDPEGGKEIWAVIPSTVLPELYHLADNNYKNTHRFYVDGTPTVGDVFDTATSSWKTVLVGGLNAGGRGYYALDVTNPLNPIALWEFTDADLGLTFGKPIISKVNGAWVAMFTSGYNNSSGRGFLYVVNAVTGAVIQKIATGVGDPTTPSNLGQINNFVDDALTNNATLRVYGADMLGNTWRFNVTATTPTATLLGTAKDPGGVPQPITVRPEIAELNGKPIVFVATGRLLGAPDVADVQRQSIYGIVDQLTGDPVYTNLRASLAPLTMTVSGSGTSITRQIDCTGSTAECGSVNGWVVNLPEDGERVNVDMKLVLGTLVVGSNVPNISACDFGGHSYFNYLNFATGLPVSGYTNVSQYLSTSLIVGFNVILVRDGYRGDVTTANATRPVVPIPVGVLPPLGKRISWREIPQ